jgi:hypothetical protein
LLLVKNMLLLRRFGLRFRLLLLLHLEEAEPEDVAERGAGCGLEELAVAAEHAQHVLQRTSAPASSPAIPSRLPRLVRQSRLVPTPPRRLRRPLVLPAAAGHGAKHGRPQ